MKKKKLLLLSLIATCLMLSSCAFIRGFSEGATHENNKKKIEQAYKDCLRQAQTAADSNACNEEKEEALEKENERHETENNIISCEEFQIHILRKWGYDVSEANEIAEKIRTQTYDKKKSSGYVLDCEDALNELREIGVYDGKKCYDKTAVFKALSILDEYKISESAEDVIEQYYDESLYLNHIYFNENATIGQCKNMILYIGEQIRINETTLKIMGFLDEEGDEDDEDEDEDDESNSDSIKNNNDSKDKNTLKEPNPPVVNNNDKKTSSNNNGEEKRINKDLSIITSIVISNYEINETQLNEDQKVEINTVIDLMMEWADAKITIVGHTCDMGEHGLNKIVGLRRAQNAKKYMISKGIDESRIQTLSKADEEPVTTNNTISGRKQNRRITFILN